MTTIHFETPPDLKKFIAESSPEEFKVQLPHFSLSEVAECFALIQAQPALESKKKFDSLLSFIDSSVTWEMLGKYFSVPNFTHFLEFLDQHPIYQNKLNLLLVGLQPLIFSQALPTLQNKHLLYLKQEGLLEPLQYHLTQFVHEGESLKQKIEQKVQQFIKNIHPLKTEELTQETLNSFLNQIDSLRNQLLDYLERISTALSIVWHTDRIDLIEKLSSLNETLQHQLTYLIGHRPFDELSSTGLYFILEQTLADIFDSTLKDEDAASEGLTRLAIWHLKDYWELGLLPSLATLQELELDANHHTEFERAMHRQNLLSLVQQQLERLQIGTVKDLKKAHLFSKSLLKDYISKHQHLLAIN